MLTKIRLKNQYKNWIKLNNNNLLQNKIKLEKIIKFYINQKFLIKWKLTQNNRFKNKMKKIYF